MNTPVAPIPDYLARVSEDVCLLRVVQYTTNKKYRKFPERVRVFW